MLYWTLQENGDIQPEVDTVGLAKLLTSVNIGFINYGIISPDREGAKRMVQAMAPLLS